MKNVSSVLFKGVPFTTHSFSGVTVRAVLVWTNLQRLQGCNFFFMLVLRWNLISVAYINLGQVVNTESLKYQLYLYVKQYKENKDVKIIQKMHL